MVQTMTPFKANVLTGERPTLGQQFTPYTGGPEEARAAYKALRVESSRNRPGWPRMEEDEPSPQGQLFSPESIARPEPHQQTPDQFAADPRTWWHGRVTKGGPKGRLGGSTVGRGEGFHAGTEEAARQRVTHNIKRRGLPEGMAGHMYPLRITGPVEGPETMREDTAKHIELGPARTRWGSTVGGRRRGYLYEQAVESPGSISVGVPQRKGFLSTQREMVAQAKAQGKKVHPLIEWAVRNAPEHTAEEIKQPTPRYQRPEHPYRQLGLHEALIPSHVIAGAQAQQGTFDAALKMQDQLQQQLEPIQRRSYVTESGKMKHVYKDLKQKDPFGPQWYPSS